VYFWKHRNLVRVSNNVWMSSIRLQHSVGIWCDSYQMLTVRDTSRYPILWSKHMCLYEATKLPILHKWYCGDTIVKNTIAIFTVLLSNGFFLNAIQKQAKLFAVSSKTDIIRLTGYQNRSLGHNNRVSLRTSHVHRSSHSQTLTTLNLWNNRIGYRGAQYLGAALKHNTVSDTYPYTLCSSLSCPPFFSVTDTHHTRPRCQCNRISRCSIS